MKYQVRIQQVSSGRYIAYCDELKRSSGVATKEEALVKLKEEIRYWLEYCPCSGVKPEWIELEVVSETSL